MSRRAHYDCGILRAYNAEEPAAEDAHLRAGCPFRRRYLGSALAIEHEAEYDSRL